MNRAAGAGLTDPAEIEANRRGQVTAAQKTRALNVLRYGPSCLGTLFNLFRYGVMAIFSIFLLVWFLAPAWVTWGLLALVVVSLLVMAAGSALGVVWRMSTMSQDVNGNRTAQGPGHLTYGRGRHEAEVPGRRLLLDSGHGLSVGMLYNFFYLPTSGLVLSAEARGPMTPAQSMESLGRSLARANGFKVSALASNRDGRLSAEQILALLPRLVAGGLFGLAGLAVAALTLAPDVQLTGGLRAFQPLLRSNVVLLVAAAIPALIGLYLGVTALGDILLGKVLAVQGAGRQTQTVSYSTSTTTGNHSPTSSRMVTYYYQIGERRFKVNWNALGALVEGLPYRAYYTALSRTLVNVEPLAAPPMV